MHTIIRAIAYCAGWVAGLFRGADAPNANTRRDWLRIHCGDTYDYDALAAKCLCCTAPREVYMVDADGHRELLGTFRPLSGIHIDHFGDAHDQVARGDG